MGSELVVTERASVPSKSGGFQKVLLCFIWIFGHEQNAGISKWVTKKYLPAVERKQTGKISLRFFLSFFLGFLTSYIKVEFTFRIWGFRAIQCVKIYRVTIVNLC